MSGLWCLVHIWATMSVSHLGCDVWLASELQCLIRIQNAMSGSHPGYDVLFTIALFFTFLSGSSLTLMLWAVQTAGSLLLCWERMSFFFFFVFMLQSLRALEECLWLLGNSAFSSLPLLFEWYSTPDKTYAPVMGLELNPVCLHYKSCFKCWDHGAGLSTCGKTQSVMKRILQSLICDSVSSSLFPIPFSNW